MTSHACLACHNSFVQVIAMEPDVGQGILANRTLQLKLAAKQQAMQTSTRNDTGAEDGSLAHLHSTLAGRVRMCA